MKNLSIQDAEASRPSASVKNAVNHCLTKLYDDQTKNISDEVVYGLTFEELLGALLLCRDAIENS